MYRSTGPVLSPGTARSLINSLSNSSPDYDSSPSESPDSLYSEGSPGFNNEAFEYDEIESRDEEEHDAMQEEEELDLNSPPWGQWPQGGVSSGPSWTPSPKSEMRRGGSGSIISISPRGSYSSSRRGSTPMTRLKSSEERRESDPTLLGFDLISQRRRSSTRSRRSSAMSAGSSVDRVASLAMLSRRFSEVVEVTCPSDEDVAMARATISLYSPDTDSETGDETDSEILTAPYIPTPQLAPTIPTVLSNFPLSSVAVEPGVNTPSDVSPIPSPMPIPARLVRPFMATPPPPPAPRAIIRAKTRVEFSRWQTDYKFPPRTNGVPPGAGPPRPIVFRAISTPYFSAAPASQEKSLLLEQRAAGTFPLGRSAPLGTSPLRQTVWRDAVHAHSDDESRRGSVSHCDSLVERGNPLEDRRMSSMREGLSFVRRTSSEAAAQSMSRTGSSIGRSSSLDRRSSSMSRKSSSGMSMTEYRYLAPSIDVDAPTPVLPALEQSLPPSIRRRSIAPQRITLPAYSFPASAPNTPGYTPRFNPMDSFFGRAPSTPSTVRGPLSPTSENDKTPMMPHLSPKGNIMDRGRPLSPPQYFGSLALSPRQRLTSQSPKSGSPEMNGRSSGESSHDAHSVRTLDDPFKLAPSRHEQAHESERRSSQQAVQGHRRTGSVEQMSPMTPRRAPYRRQATLPPNLEHMPIQSSSFTSITSPNQARPSSSNTTPNQPGRISNPYRQATNPSKGILSPPRNQSENVFNPAAKTNTPSRQPENRHSPPSRQTEAHHGSSSKQPDRIQQPVKTITKKVSVTFAEPRRPAIPRASSFTRLFQGRGSKSNSGRPRSMEPISAPAPAHEGTSVGGGYWGGGGTHLF